MNDRYATHQKGVNSPGDDLKQITFSDTVDMDDLPRFIHVNTTGTLRVLLEKSQSAEDN